MVIESVAGITMVKDEIDIIERTLDHMLNQVDAVFVQDNGSTDGTWEFLIEMACEHPIILSRDLSPGYYQSFKMSELAREAAHQGHDWVVPFDADEIWMTASGETIANYLDVYGKSAVIAVATLLNYVPTPDGYDKWRYKSVGMPKVACRPLLPVTIEQGNHGAHYPPQDWIRGGLIVHHHPYRSFEQFVKKIRNGAAAYKAAPDLPSGMGSHWRQWGEILDAQGEEGLRQVWESEIFRRHPARNSDVTSDALNLL